MTFVVRKKIDLSFLGVGWENSYITFTPFSFNDNSDLMHLRELIGLSTIKHDNDVQALENAEKASKELMKLLKDKLIDGEGWDGTKLIPITKENFQDLPMEIVSKLLSALQAGTTIPPNE